jgi:hypothetical protein
VFGLPIVSVMLMASEIDATGSRPRWHLGCAGVAARVPFRICGELSGQLMIEVARCEHRLSVMDRAQRRDD